MVKEMNKNQEILMDALKSIHIGRMNLEDAQDVFSKMTKKEIEEVISRFEYIYSEFIPKEFYEDIYNFEEYANQIVTGIINKLVKKD